MSHENDHDFRNQHKILVLEMLTNPCGELVTKILLHSVIGTVYNIILFLHFCNYVLVFFLFFLFFCSEDAIERCYLLDTSQKCQNYFSTGKTSFSVFIEWGIVTFS